MMQLDIIKSKILNSENLNIHLNVWRFKDQKIVFTNGCFDILHHGHIIYLSRAKDLGNKLIIGLNSDPSVKRLKGEGRPVNNQDSRAISLASLQFVDAVILFDEDTPYELINRVQPDILVKGSDYNPEEIIGADIVLAGGGKIHTIDFVEGYSSTNIINKLKK